MHPRNLPFACLVLTWLVFTFTSGLCAGISQALHTQCYGQPSQGLMHTTGKHPSNSVKFPALHFMILGAEEMAQWLRVLAALAGGIPFQFLIPRWEPLSGDPTPSNLPRQTWCTYIKAGTYKHIIIQQQKPPSFSMYLSMCTSRGQMDKGSQLCSYGKAVQCF